MVYGARNAGWEYLHGCFNELLLVPWQCFGRVQFLRAPFFSLASAGHSDRQVTAAYGHFGRKPYTENGMKFFEWENAKDLSEYSKMTSAQVA